MFLNMDMAVLGVGPAAGDRYAQGVAAEFVPVVGAAAYRMGRKRSCAAFPTAADRCSIRGRRGPRSTGRPTEPGHLRLTVCDEGPGLPPEFDATRSKSLGMKLIASLGRQLGGRPEWQEANPGTRFVLDFFAQERPSHDV